MLLRPKEKELVEPFSEDEKQRGIYDVRIPVKMEVTMKKKGEIVGKTIFLVKCNTHGSTEFGWQDLGDEKSRLFTSMKDLWKYLDDEFNTYLDKTVESAAFGIDRGTYD